MSQTLIRVINELVKEAVDEFLARITKLKWFRAISLECYKTVHKHE